MNKSVRRSADALTVMFNLILMLVWSALGFTLGVFIISAIRPLRSRPRLLMAIGAAVMPVLGAFHLVVPLRVAFFGPDLLLMMAGVGMIVAGWEAEVELEHQLLDERRRRLRAVWELRQIASSRTGASPEIDARPESMELLDLPATAESTADPSID